MRLARVLGAIGRGLISAGVIVLLFVAYQLWGTGIQNERAQDDLQNEAAEAGLEVSATDADTFRELVEQSQEDIAAGLVLPNSDIVVNDSSAEPSEDDGAPSAGNEPSAALVAVDLTEQELQSFAAELYPEPGEVFARIYIPDINVDQISVEGVSVEDLRKGPGHYRTTPNPGQAGNAAIAGHRTTYGAPFHRVDELDPGDSIFVSTAQGNFEYRVLGFSEDGERGGDVGHFIVNPSDTWVLGQDGNENILTLTACHPKYSARQRIIVQAELVGEPAATIPRDQAGDLVPATLDSGAVDERAQAADALDPSTVEEANAIGDVEPVDGDDSAAGGNSAGAETQDDIDTETASGTEDAVTEPEVAAAPDAELEAPAIDEVVLDTSDDGDTALVVAQTPFGSADDFGEGLNGDRTKVTPAIMWGIAGVSIWMAAWFMGQRLNRKWTLYAIGLVPFALVLWSAFVNIDQALPSY